MDISRDYVQRYIKKTDILKKNSFQFKTVYGEKSKFLISNVKAFSNVRSGLM
jgi:hypothetical protein